MDGDTDDDTGHALSARRPDLAHPEGHDGGHSEADAEWHLANGTWRMAYGVWHMAYGMWPIPSDLLIRTWKGDFCQESWEGAPGTRNGRDRQPIATRTGEAVAVNSGR